MDAEPHVESACSGFQTVIVPFRPWNIIVVSVPAMGSRCFVFGIVKPFVQLNGFLYFWPTLADLWPRLFTPQNCINTSPALRCQIPHRSLRRSSSPRPLLSLSGVRASEL